MNAAIAKKKHNKVSNVCMPCCLFRSRKFSLLVLTFWPLSLFALVCPTFSLQNIFCQFVGHNMFLSTSLLLPVSLMFLPSLSLSFWIQELLMFKLRGSTNSPSHPPHSVNFDLGSESHVDTARFNPLHQFDHIGKRKLDQVCQAFSRLS